MGDEQMTRNVNGVEGGGHLSNINLLENRPVSVPAKNFHRVADAASRGKELSNAFLDKFRRVKPLQEYILQGGQRFCRPTTNEHLKGRRDTWHNFLR